MKTTATFYGIELPKNAACKRRKLHADYDGKPALFVRSQMAHLRMEISRINGRVVKIDVTCEWK